MHKYKIVLFINFYLILFQSINLNVIYGQNKVAKITESKDKEAENILYKLKKKFETSKNVSIDFSTSVDYNNSKTKTNFKGKYYSTGNSFYISLKDIIVFSDGKDIYNVNKPSKEIIINTISKKKNISTPFDFIKNYNILYKYRVKDENKYTNTLELVPLEKNSDIFKIDLNIQKSTNNLYKIKVYERNGMRIDYNILNTKVNSAVNSNIYKYTKTSYPNYEIIDMR